MRLPLPRLSWFASLLGRPILLYSVYTAALFVFFLVETFPHDVITRRIEDLTRNSPVGVDIAGARFAWLRGGYELEGVRVAAQPRTEGVPPFLEWTSLLVRPDYSALLKGDVRTVVVSGNLYGGRATGYVSQRDGSLAGRFQWSDLDIRRYRGIAVLVDKGKVTGRLSGSWSMEMPNGDAAGAQGSGQLTLAGAGISNGMIKGFKVPDLRLEETNAKVTLNGDRIDLMEFSATGPEIAVEANGTIMVRDNWPATILNLNVTIQNLPEDLKPMLAFIPRRGRATNRNAVPTTLAISGSVGRPVIR